MTLFDIKTYLDSLVDSFAALLDLELTVISAESTPLRRVCGTGFYRQERPEVLHNYWQHSYTNMCAEQNEPLVILDTSPYIQLLAEPDRKYFGPNYSILLYPIRTRENHVVGVIVLASFTDRQQQLLLSKKDRLMDYLALTSELISLKLEQEQLLAHTETMNQQLSAMNEAFENGVLFYSAAAGIQQINQRAKQFLHMDDSHISRILLAQTLQIARSADKAGRKITQEIFHSDNDHSYFLTIQALPLNNAGRDVVCIVMPFAKVQDSILQQGSQPAIADDDIVATSQAIQDLLGRVKTAAKHTSNVLILGESGTGKEMFARMIHANSDRKDGPFVTINCAAIPETLLESELFGYEEGSFTGARKGGRIGKFMLADRGTLFLDEIGDMPLYLQAKLLRVLQERKVDRLGGAAPVDVDVRIVAATNRNLEEMIRNREFRDDLYYRLSVIPFVIPPLRQRKEDVVALVKHFIAKYNTKLDKQIEGIQEDALNLLLAYDWPGNVRELENCLEYMMNFERTPRLTPASMPPKLFEQASRIVPPTGASIPSPGPSLRPLKQMLADYEAGLFSAFLQAHAGKPSLEAIDQFCAQLCISRATYYRKCQEAKLTSHN
ncbi:MAG: sigma 54-interacting transcriptional regulator [Pygmaiobacter massiliensis]|nr:sigma 54-interacting transcriptional regulator [Pygmaiobacter massiliensis]